MDVPEIDFEHGYRVERNLHRKVKVEMISSKYGVTPDTVTEVIEELGVEAAMVYLNGMRNTVDADAKYAEETYNRAANPQTYTTGKRSK